jgi:molybdate/tungstate transport system permease protein
MSRRPRSLALFCGLLGGLLLLDLVLPVANLLVQADWPAWTAALRTSGARGALGVSIASSTIAMLVMTLLGVPLGWLLARSRVPLKQLWVALVFLPMVVPDLAGGILLLQTFGPRGLVGQPLAAPGIELTNNLAGIVLSQIFVASPFVIVSALAAFSGVDPRLEAAAATLGDSAWRSFWRISLPLAWPGIAAGITLAWIRAMGEFGGTLIMAYNPHSLPVYLWVAFESDGLAGALPAAFCLVALAAAAVAASMLLNRLSGAARLMTSPGGA